MSNKILVLNGKGYAEAITGLGNIIFDKDCFLQDPKSFKLVMFTGGEDVDPAFYGHTSPKHMCHYNTRRDIDEAVVYRCAVQHGIKMTGICRGSQFLNIMAGGTLIHHLTGHHGNHNMVCGNTGDVIEVTSTHHQMCLPSEDGIVVAWSDERRSTFYIGDKDDKVKYDGPEVEAVCYPNSGIFAVQYHPEWMDNNSAGYLWYKNAIDDLLSLDICEFVNKYCPSIHLENYN